MRRLRLLVVDDHEVVRLGLRLLLQNRPEFELVGEAESGAQALALVERLRPDLVILDVRLPDRDGLEVCREITERFPGVRVLILTAYPDEAFIVRAIEAGASGYVLKRAGSRELVQALEALARGEAILDPAVTRKVLEQFRQRARAAQADAFKDLTPRERLILARIAEGKTNKEIAEELFLTEKTVRNYVSIILDKLGVSNRVEAAAYALKHRIHDFISE
ncbi:Transcriptional regulatory protein DevR (DosR) [Candidatus Thermoflexus japonica]|uniref:Transcriptional regulatory protein DevR (DosR) n=1 Tax=Candidatus Thermoflexus japonica TaxID=2035417 RepID=A0A2H5Y9B9_9CHLR|nr:Transcriptional regulatory protein DevR (DosR) [Candidatus Thermoflexus japonica]